MADYCTLRDLRGPFKDGPIRLDRVVVGRTVYLALSAASEMRFAGKAGQIAPAQVAIDVPNRNPAPLFSPFFSVKTEKKGPSEARQNRPRRYESPLFAEPLFL